MRRGREQARGDLLALDADRLAVEAARRDSRQFESLYRKYVAQVYSFAFYELRDQHAAEDVTATVFMRALAGLPRFRERAEAPHSSFRVWLFQIARHTLANERRRARRHPEAPLELALGVPAGDDVAGTVGRREELLRAWRAIEELPAERRQALTLRLVHEMNAADIAAVLGRSEGAVRVLVHRALRSVARRLARGDA
ncbi:MAG: RNA polymerase sigma factor [Chloroflexota bacterium]|nr:RNA polymerase sigma factor [Chloroflexota bacterium]